MPISHLALQRHWSSILRKQLSENKFYIHVCNLEKNQIYWDMVDYHNISKKKKKLDKLMSIY